jgi:hypothetical protein
MNKEQQKKLITEIMEADEKDGLYETVTSDHSLTSIEWLIENLPERFKNAIINTCAEEIEHSKAMEMEKIIRAYEVGWKNGSLKKAPSFGIDYYNNINK